MKLAASSNDYNAYKIGQIVNGIRISVIKKATDNPNLWDFWGYSIV